MNNTNEQSELLTLQEAADLLGTSRSKVWRAKGEQTLQVDKTRINGRKVWTVERSELLRWARVWMDDSEFDAIGEQNETNELNRPNEQTEQVLNEENEQDEQVEHFELNDLNNPNNQNEHQLDVEGLCLAMMERVARSERRQVELEMELRKHRLLLSENAESLTQERAKKMEEESKFLAAQEAEKQAREAAEIAQREAEEIRAKFENSDKELQALKTEMAIKESKWEEARRPWYKKLFKKSS